MVVDHLSWLSDLQKEELPLDYYFLDDFLSVLMQYELPWYTNFVKYLAVGVLPLEMNYQQNKKVLFRSKTLLLGWTPTI